VEILVRFAIGGLVVSFFSLLADALRPRSFAGLFGAAPSVALATLGLTILENGSSNAAIEARSMMIGALAFLIYACVVARLLTRTSWHTWVVATSCLALWAVCAFAISRAVL
jgi:hypothetical protein